MRRWIVWAAAGTVALGVVVGGVLVIVLSTRADAEHRRTQLFDYASQIDPAGTSAVLTATSYVGSSTCMPLTGCEKQKIWLTYSTTATTEDEVCALARSMVEASLGEVRLTSLVTAPCEWVVVPPATGDDVVVEASVAGLVPGSADALALVVTLQSGID